MLQAQLKMAGVDVQSQTVSMPMPASTQAVTDNKHHLTPMRAQRHRPWFPAPGCPLRIEVNLTGRRSTTPEIDLLPDQADAHEGHGAPAWRCTSRCSRWSWTRR